MSVLSLQRRSKVISRISNQITSYNELTSKKHVLEPRERAKGEIMAIMNEQGTTYANAIEPILDNIEYLETKSAIILCFSFMLYQDLKIIGSKIEMRKKEEIIDKYVEKVINYSKLKEKDIKISREHLKYAIKKELVLTNISLKSIDETTIR